MSIQKLIKQIEQENPTIEQELTELKGYQQATDLIYDLIEELDEYYEENYNTKYKLTKELLTEYGYTSDNDFNNELWQLTKNDLLNEFENILGDSNGSEYTEEQIRTEIKNRMTGE